MTESLAEKKRNRRSVTQLLAAYQVALHEFDQKVAKRREQLSTRIERLTNRHAFIVLAHEALDGKTPEGALAEIDAELEALRLKRKAVRKVSKIA